MTLSTSLVTLWYSSDPFKTSAVVASRTTASSSLRRNSALARLSSATSSSSVALICLLRRALLSTGYYLDRHPLHPRRRYESIIFSSGASRRLDIKGLARSHRLKSTMFFSKNFEYPLADEWWCDVFPTSKSRCSFHARNRSPDLENRLSTRNHSGRCRAQSLRPPIQERTRRIAKAPTSPPASRPRFRSQFIDPSSLWHDTHSITSLARARINCGTVRPSVFAVFRLTTRSNSVGWTTGRSAGFSPFSTRPT